MRADVVCWEKNDVSGLGLDSDVQVGEVHFPAFVVIVEICETIDHLVHRDFSTAVVALTVNGESVGVVVVMQTEVCSGQIFEAVAAHSPPDRVDDQRIQIAVPDQAVVEAFFYILEETPDFVWCPWVDWLGHSHAAYPHWESEQVFHVHDFAVEGFSVEHVSFIVFDDFKTTRWDVCHFVDVWQNQVLIDIEHVVEVDYTAWIARVFDIANSLTVVIIQTVVGELVSSGGSKSCGHVNILADSVSDDDT